MKSPSRVPLNTTEESETCPLLLDLIMRKTAELAKVHQMEKDRPSPKAERNRQQEELRRRLAENRLATSGSPITVTSSAEDAKPVETVREVQVRRQVLKKQVESALAKREAEKKKAG